MEILRKLSQNNDLNKKVEIIGSDVINIFYFNFFPFNIGK